MSALFDLTGRRALVTGGGSGIGLAMARALAEHGAAVSLWGRNPGKVRTAADELTAGGAVAHAQQVDVSDEAAVADGVRETVGLLGGLDVVVVNAGLGVPLKPLVDTTAEDYRTVMATNLDGAFWTLRETARVLVERGTGGSVIAVASLAALSGAARNHAYGASKAGLTAFVRSAAVELARYGIRVNGVLPGWTATDMTTTAQGSQVFTDRVISRVPLGRWGRPEEFGGIAVYLAADASSYQTGTTVLVDGGYAVF
ncbi:SDR family NAD(P)-dependent oxidoreductase [Petropleomorpha daqingensis]|uniref:NAD(P)-dependent dehydrogenase (Short-subunit alcohol dehydrogenase family) n=1 Tax=Petropleomorpha daqingensis TaxID=2026353 RepID=A0A853CJ07_9ACTN|nr:SDR family oxidoreductase [Petropleomorpha daqingensis]NYJ07527.1 NAD(P)-dependent dehydrogenase (short-subunit alcohol dehydrogenase family) [Petropleomorpha daqingensis]